MRKSGKLIVMFLLFFTGTFFIFQARFRKGESFPDYSTLKTEPLGTLVLFESLQKTANLIVTRNYSSTSIERYSNSTLFFIGVQPDAFEKAGSFTRLIDTLLKNGNRVIVSFLDFPFYSPSISPSDSLNKKDVPFIHSFIVRKKFSDTGATTSTDDFFKKMVWPGTLGLQADSSWNIIVSRDSLMLLGEKKVYSGVLVALHDGYNLSNQGLRENLTKNGSNPLIPYLIGTGSTIIFDESHHGIVKRMGISALLQKSGFTPVIVFLCIWFLLLVWYLQGINIRIHPVATADNEQLDTPDSLQLILTSRISAKKLLQVCREEWQKCFPAVQLPDVEGNTNVNKYNSQIKNKRY